MNGERLERAYGKYNFRRFIRNDGWSTTDTLTCKKPIPVERTRALDVHRSSAAAQPDRDRGSLDSGSGRCLYRLVWHRRHGIYRPANFPATFAVIPSSQSADEQYNLDADISKCAGCVGIVGRLHADRRHALGRWCYESHTSFRM